METKNLFSTPVFSTIFDDANELNPRLLYEGLEVKSNNNYFDLKTPAISTLYQRCSELLEAIRKQYLPTRPQLNIYARQNVLNPLQCDTPHYHGLMAAVYYVDVPKNSGDLLLHDPRGNTTGWENLDFEPNDPTKNKYSRCYHRINPVDGMLVVFPGFLVHSVETNLSQKNRTSIVMNIF